MPNIKTLKLSHAFLVAALQNMQSLGVQDMEVGVVDESGDGNITLPYVIHEGKMVPGSTLPVEPANTPELEPEADAKVDLSDATALVKMTLAELQRLADNLGVEHAGLKKAELVNAIMQSANEVSGQ